MSDNNRNLLQCSPEHIDNPQNVVIDACSDVMSCELKEVLLDRQGSILDISARLYGVCPGKRVSVGLILHELDAAGNEYARGMKTMLLPAHQESGPCDVLVKSVRFVLPAELDLRSTADASRRFIVRTIAHYADGDWCGRNNA